MLISVIIKLNKLQIKRYQDNFEPNKDLRFENCIKSFDKFKKSKIKRHQKLMT